MKRVSMAVMMFVMFVVGSAPAMAQVTMTRLDQVLPAHTMSRANGVANDGTIVGDISFADATRGFVAKATSVTLIAPPTGFEWTSARAISPNGKFVAGSVGNGGASYPAFWVNGQTVVISDRGGYALDCNNAGEVLFRLYGTYDFAGGTFRRLADGTVVTLPCNGNALNATGFVAGSANGTPVRCKPDGTLVLLPASGGLGVGFGIDNNKRVVGTVQDSTYAVFPSLWVGRTLTNLGNLSGTNSGIARSINKSGAIVGSCGDATWEQACYWQALTPGALALPTGGLNGNALRVNAGGRAVGYVWVGGNQRAVRWDNVH